VLSFFFFFVVLASDDGIISNRITRHGSMVFPAVTVCNMNPVRMSKVSLGGTYFDTAMRLVSAKLTQANTQQTVPEVGLISGH